MAGYAVQGTFTTGISEDRQEYVWRIENWNLVVQIDELLFKQKIQINTGKSSKCPSKWEVGIKPSKDDENSLTYYLKLLENLGNHTKIAVKFAVEVMDTKFAENKNFNKTYVIKVGDFLEFDWYWKDKNYSDWSRYLDEKGTLVHAITLALYHPVSH